MGMVAFVGFWVAAGRLWIADGPRIPIIFIVFWLAAYIGVPALGVPGLFIATEAILAAILLMIERYKNALH